jgi:hypothetical protein
MVSSISPRVCREQDVGGGVDAGGVFVLFGSSSGLTTANRDFLLQDSGGGSETDDRFGEALASEKGTAPAEQSGLPGPACRRRGAASGTGNDSDAPGVEAYTPTMCESRAHPNAEGALAEDNDCPDPTTFAEIRPHRRP